MPLSDVPQTKAATAMASTDATHAVVRGVTRVYDNGVHALGPIDIDLARGEFLSVVGPSGCGKSTFLDLLAGLSAPSEGTITFEGQNVAGTVPDGVGVVFQEDATFPWLTVANNIGFGLKRRGASSSEIRDRVRQAIDFMGLQQFADAYPSQLSGGMRQRVCIARTLVLEPRLILLDEPFGALDQQTRLLMGDELLRLWRSSGATVMLITHALDEATLLADRVAVMSARPGRFIELVSTGWPRERDSRIAASPDFGKVTTHIWEVLRDESIKAMSGNARVSQ
ncbi:MAG: ATP-binding cassette domain-containing protein [Rhizobiales bacterium]|nr:ATP-binding cassette domain-containing protein [Hyphomicrobiales bacterium]